MTEHANSASANVSGHTLGTASRIRRTFRGKDPTRWITISDLRDAARRRLPHMIFDYVDGGAGDEVTSRENLQAFNALRLLPQVLVNVAERNQRVELLGEQLRMPVICGPAGMPALAHPGAELAAAAAAHDAGTVFVISSASSYSTRSIARSSTGPLWFQLYAWRDRDTAATLIDQARDAGARVLVLTVDCPVPGQRERDLRNGMTIPPRPSFTNAVDLARNPGWCLRFLRGPRIELANLAGLEAAPAHGALGAAGWLQHLFNPAQTWDDLTWYIRRWGGPVLVKGIMSATDARRAVELGAAGVIVSNHGGRQLDHTPAAIRVLPAISNALADTSAIVLLDGGIRRGIDVIKALALGADACLIGRPWMYGLAAAGYPGVLRALDIFQDEIDRALALLGRQCVSEIDSGTLWHPPPGEQTRAD